MEYQAYMDGKKQNIEQQGFDPIYMPDFLFDFQKYLVGWCIEKGRSALFADCGLGKSIMELVTAYNIIAKTNGNVLIITPLAVGEQMLREAVKFGIDEDISRSKKGEVTKKITITNYERLHYFNPSDFVGVILDESSILKNFKGAIKTQINIFLRKIKYRLLATATAAPNDFTELGTSSEALGYLGYMDMLCKFFKNEQNNCANNKHNRFFEATKWRLKGHSETFFWRWVTSWSKAVRTPSDIGFPDGGFLLPELKQIEHRLNVSRPPDPGELFTHEAIGLKAVRDERRATVAERCEKVAEIVNSHNDHAVVWCNLNDEADLAEKLIPGSVQVSGSDSDDKKENKLIDFSKGNIRVLVTKPKIGAWGMNWQHCNRVTFFPAYSYEQYYQAIRRCWRFGQKKPVIVDIIYTDGDKNSIKNLNRKQSQADEMFTMLVQEMNNSLGINTSPYGDKKMEVPSWL